MTQFNFEGSFENISNGQLEFINKVISDQGINVNKIKFESVGKAGDNFAANVKRIVIEGEDKSLQLIAKIAPQNETVRQLIKTTPSFVNEHIMYTEFFPKLEEMQIEAGVPKKERLRYAKCYGSLTEYLHEIILLEDLNLSEFTILDKFVSMTDDCIRSVLKNFAILHSLSYMLKFREPEKFEDFKRRIIDMWSLFAKDDLAEAIVKQIETNIVTVFDEDSVKNKIKSKIDNMTTDMITLSEYELNNKNSVILQGDAWTNNFMFRFKEDLLLESIIIDYQLTRNGNPMNDVMFMIFNCTDFETRSKNYFHWIDYYHTELDKSLSYFNLKASSVYPRNEMDADIKKYARLVFSQSCMACSIAMRTSDESVEIMDALHNSNDISELMDTVNTDKLQDESRNKIKRKITDIIKSLEEYDLFE